MRDAQRRHRPSLKDWERDGLCEKFPEYVRGLSSPEERYRSFVLRPEPPHCNQRHKETDSRSHQHHRQM
jgi:hypothetical protein